MQIEKTWFEIIKRKRKIFGENQRRVWVYVWERKCKEGGRRRRRTDRTFRHVKIRFYWLPGVIYLIIVILEIMTTLIFYFFLREARPSLDGLPSNLTRRFGLGWVGWLFRFGLGCQPPPFLLVQKTCLPFFLSTSSFFLFFYYYFNFFLLGMLWSMSYYEFVILIQYVFLKKKLFILKYIKII